MNSRNYRYIPVVLALAAAMTGCSQNAVSLPAKPTDSYVQDGTQESSVVQVKPSESSGLLTIDECLSISDLWTERWENITENTDMVQPKASVIGAEYSGGTLAVIIYPEYKSNAFYAYRVSSDGIVELGKGYCGAENSFYTSGSDILMLTKLSTYPSAGAETAGVQPTEYTILYKNGVNVIVDLSQNSGTCFNELVQYELTREWISQEEFEKIKSDALDGAELVRSFDLTVDNAGFPTEYFSFEGNSTGFAQYIFDRLTGETPAAE